MTIVDFGLKYASVNSRCARFLLLANQAQNAICLSILHVCYISCAQYADAELQVPLATSLNAFRIWQARAHLCARFAHIRFAYHPAAVCLTLMSSECSPKFTFWMRFCSSPLSNCEPSVCRETNAGSSEIGSGAAGSASYECCDH